MEDNYFTILYMFFAICQRIGHRYTCVPLILNPASHFPSHPGLFRSAGFGCPARCFELALAISFTSGNAHLSMLFSQIILPSPSPTVQKSVLYICVSFCCPACRNVGTIFLNSIYIHEYTVFVFLFLTYFTLYNRLQFFHFIRTESNVVLLIAE